VKNSFKKEIQKNLLFMYTILIIVVLLLSHSMYASFLQNELKEYEHHLLKLHDFSSSDIYTGTTTPDYTSKIHILSNVVFAKSIPIYPLYKNKHYLLDFLPSTPYYSFLTYPLSLLVIIMFCNHIVVRRLVKRRIRRFKYFEDYLYSYLSDGHIKDEIFEKINEYDDEICNLSQQAHSLMVENIKIKEKQEKFFKTLDTLNEVVLELSYDFIIQEHNRPWLDIRDNINNFLYYLNRKNLATVQVKSSELLHNEISEIVFVDSLNKDGSFFQVKMINIGTNVFGVVISDISFTHKEHQKTKHKSLHDALTGLPNRTLFLDRLENEIRKSKRNNKLVGVLFFDLNKFKNINDDYGHAFGDAYLVEFSRRVSGALRDSDTCARIGGDEFVAILADLQSEDEIKTIIDKIHDSISEVFSYEDHQLPIKASIGASLYPDDGIDADVLILKADNAMYKSKKNNKKYSRYIEE
jgi:diguanylate cyclase (GGDEF)-like protein